MEKATGAQRGKAFNLAKDAGLLDYKGKPTAEFATLIKQVTGKDRMAIMTREEADRLLQALESLPKIERKTFSTGRPHFIPALVAATMLLIALADLEYGYYQFLRWVICAVSVFIAYKSYSWGKGWGIWTFAAIAVLFNPLFPITFEKETWQPIDLICAVLFGLSIFFLKEPKKGEREENGKVIPN